ncbi:peptidase M23 [Streptomyces hygroscopicus]|uniref:peptidoglycan DD-metalloendopeptidase family protein n=1 Tax=Streptomyces hygroscopicus TaxID=1912 RepID=UPI00223F9737|nr:M23 family metallopeptidase [Streptomyces hygroscopicus]MCW7941990.1 peptidase M23 [Streptomyces hygroscopicus]
MGSSRGSSLFVPLLLCALAVFLARPTAAESGAGGGETDSGVSARVARLSEDAGAVTRRYDAGRREAAKQRAKALRSGRLLSRERRRVAVLRKDLGRIARAQYRQGGGLPCTARTLFSGTPEELMRSEHVHEQADLAVEHAVVKSLGAQARLAVDEARASAQWRALEKRNGELAGKQRTLQTQLEEARQVLQGRADESAAAGSCQGAVRLGRPRAKTTRTWVAPVETYRLSAGFGSGGDHWANRHTGQDFAVPIGTPVRAVGAGKVVKVECGGAFGIQIVIRHPGGYCTQYAHLAAVTVDQGERVTPGQWIAQSGTTGNSTGPHLHFEVRTTEDLESSIDPVPWLTARGVQVRGPVSK